MSLITSEELGHVHLLYYYYYQLIKIDISFIVCNYFDTTEKKHPN